MADAVRPACTSSILHALDDGERCLQIVVIGGTLDNRSTTSLVTRWMADACAERSAAVAEFAGPAIDFPLFDLRRPTRSSQQRAYVDAVASADGLIIVSPTYHGTISGLVKNALDYINDLWSAPFPLFTGRPVACVAVGASDFGAAATLVTLRQICHALGAWPTPLGVGITAKDIAQSSGLIDAGTKRRSISMIDQLLSMARRVATDRSVQWEGER